ncbi:unnamed protein product, partial [Ranitomeya imitator]
LPALTGERRPAVKQSTAVTSPLYFTAGAQSVLEAEGEGPDQTPGIRNLKTHLFKKAYNNRAAARATAARAAALPLPSVSSPLSHRIRNLKTHLFKKAYNNRAAARATAARAAALPLPSVSSPLSHRIMYKKYDPSRIRAEDEVFSSKRCLEWFYEYADQMTAVTGEPSGDAPLLGTSRLNKESDGSRRTQSKKELGWIVNFEKSRLNPETVQTFLGIQLDSFCKENLVLSFSGTDDIVGPEGMEKFCEDICVEPENVVMLVLAWKLDAQNMGYFTLQEWLKGMTSLQCDATEKLRNTLDYLRSLLNEPANFKLIYRYAFDFAREKDQRSLDMNTAKCMLGLLLGKTWPLFPVFHQFLETVQEESREAERSAGGQTAVATKQRRCSDPDRCRYRCSVAKCEGALRSYTAARNHDTRVLQRSYHCFPAQSLTFTEKLLSNFTDRIACCNNRMNVTTARTFRLFRSMCAAFFCKLMGNCCGPAAAETLWIRSAFRIVCTYP